MTSAKATTKSSKRAPRGMDAYLKEYSKRLGKTEALRQGSILLRLTGTGGGDYGIESSEKGVSIAKGAPRERPLIEVMGDARMIRSILDGKKDARKQFLVGGIRVRGDLRYLSDLGMELGIIKEPL